MTEVLLTICIPTYNRIKFLKHSLENYVLDPNFEKFEIVISDNCSDDGTEQMVKEFIHKYSNIRYNKHETNIGADLNLTKALEMGTGKYLKLINDTAFIKPNGISKILEIIGSNLDSRSGLLFYKNNIFNSNTQRSVSTIDDLVNETSYFITWILNFGIWRDEFVSLENKNKAASLRFNQVDWTYRIIGNKNITIFFDDYYTISEDKNKGGYLLFKTFGVDYLSMFDHYLHSGQLKRKTYNIEKYRLFRHFLLIYYYKLKLDNKVNNFDTSNATRYLQVNYKYKAYYYIGIIYANIFVIIKKTKRIFRVC